MPKYKAFLREELLHIVEFEADDFATACNLAYEIVETGNPDLYKTESNGVFDLDLEEITNA